MTVFAFALATAVTGALALGVINDAAATAAPRADSSGFSSLAPASARWAVQVGSFTEIENAEALRDELQAAGFAAFEERAVSAGERVFRVLVGPEKDRGSAGALQTKLRIQEGLEGIVVSRYPSTPESRATPGMRTAAKTSATTPNPGSTRASAPDNERPDEQVTQAIIARALERSLIQEGALLLPAGLLQIEPELSYTFRGINALGLVETGDNDTVITPQDQRRDILTAGLVLRAGLPWGSQAELRVPYVITDEEVTTTGLAQETRDLSGLGDIELAFDKLLWRAAGWLPQTVGSVRWKTTTGSFEPAPDEGLRGTAGFNTLQGEVTAVKTQDPLVFFGSLAYTLAFSKETNAGQLEPGDTFGVSLGTVLAVSPETSLRLALSQAFFQQAKQNGSEIPGSDSVGAVLEVGLASILSQSTLLDLTVGAGLTQDSPDYQLVVSLPIQTGLLSSL